MRVRTMRGACVSDVRQTIETLDLTGLQNVIIQAGGNDLSNKRNPEAIKDDFAEIINDIRYRSPDVKVFIGEILPRFDVIQQDRMELNAILGKMCVMYGATLIPTTRSIPRISALHYWIDDLHLSDYGTSLLLKEYNKFVSVVKTKEVKSACFNCGENGHNTKRCHHGGKLQCYDCQEFGHKAKFCPY